MSGPISAILAGNSIAAEKVGEFPASGIVFKDSVQTLAIDDPEVQGVTIYISGQALGAAVHVQSNRGHSIHNMHFTIPPASEGPLFAFWSQKYL